MSKGPKLILIKIDAYFHFVFFTFFTASGTTIVAAIFCHVVMLVAVGLLEFTM